MDLLNYLLSHQAFICKADVKGWQAALKLSTDRLISTKAIEPRYYDEIIKSIDTHGPYFVIAPGIAMPHARPECGVLQTGYCLVTLKTPVEFGHEDNDPVDIILTIAAKDKKALNEDVIVQVMTLFESEETLRKLRDAQNNAGMIDVLANLDLSASLDF